MEKRDRKVLLCLSDEEHSLLESLVECYSVCGHRASKSFVLRYALRFLPKQSILPFPVPVLDCPDSFEVKPLSIY